MKRRDAIFVEVAHGQHQPKVPSRVCIVRARRLLLRVEAAQHLPDVKLGVLSIPTRDRQARKARGTIKRMAKKTSVPGK